ncbi:hypothetical protein D7Y09_00185 [bacterium 1XD42-1]|nr:hypothetical protein D7X25_01785 [bacterium 1XD42-8]RKJ67572.1 hypothetical protein D7Y09_00185 [bacterium 1XD42-1]
MQPAKTLGLYSVNFLSPFIFAARLLSDRRAVCRFLSFLLYNSNSMDCHVRQITMVFSVDYYKILIIFFLSIYKNNNSC